MAIVEFYNCLSKTVNIIKIEYEISNKFSKNYDFVSTQSYTEVPTIRPTLKIDGRIERMLRYETLCERSLVMFAVHRNAS